jgi:EAL domain-containing protein (putative c-di-GMP-specific phosphodiesterase class I)
MTVVTAVPTFEQARSAGHYVVRAGAAAALNSTLKLAADLSGFAVAAVHVIDASQIHRVAEYGEFKNGRALPPSPAPRDSLPCGAVMELEQTLVVPDTQRNPICAPLALIAADGGIRSYVGVPLRGREGLTIGVLCVMDTAPRPDAERQLPFLTELALVVEDQLELTRRRTEQAPRQSGASLREIRRALANGQIQPYYQPLVELADNVVIGFEVLARWEHADGHLVDAQEFLPHAADSELIVEIDRSMLNQALEDVCAWRPALAGLQLSVNASGPWARSSTFLDDVLGGLARHGVPPQRLTIELTESVLLEREPRITANLAAVRAGGCRVALDDFGTGWASMEYLLRLPVDELKIDQTFTAALGTPLGDSLVRSTTQLAAELGLTCVVEGIESAEQLRQVSAMSAGIGQGFYWSPAIPAQQLQQQLAQTADAVA